MKIAVLSDIHGNLPALEVVAADIERWGADLTVVNGDVVNRGPLPQICWAFVQERREESGWRVVGGNHEQYVAEWQDPDVPRQGAAFEVNRSSYWTYRKLGAEASALVELPEQETVIDPGGGEVRITHGSMRGNTDGIYPETEAAELAEQIAPAPTVFCTGHTHRPLLRRLNGTLVVNSGSAGTTFDGDPRASYAQLVWERGSWQARIVRLPYDRAHAARDFVESGFMAEAGPVVRIFFEEWWQARPMIYRWTQQYQAAVLAGEIGLAAAVDAFLADENEATVAGDDGRSAK